TAIGTNFYGIFANNSAAGTSLSITANDVTGNINGIRALNYGTAGLTISVTGDVTGETAEGIFAYNSANDISASMVINQDAGEVATGATDGMYAENLGGSLTINALGTVIGQSGDGIDARNGVGTTDLTITSNVATGAINGILALNAGTGAVTVTSTGTATGTDLFGIFAQNSGNGTDLTLASANSIGGIDGILAINNGTGALSVTSTGTATGTTSDGIDARNSANGTDLMVTAFSTNGGERGVYANNQGNGVLTISTTGDVTGEIAEGIFAYNSAAGTAMDINQDAGATTTGATDGMYADNNGGSLTINALGTVIGETGDGIDARNRAGTLDLTITSNIATGANNGINARNYGSGALSVTSTGTATGTIFDAIEAFNSVNGTDLTVNAVDTLGDDNGIHASNQGIGALTINSTGTATGSSTDGILAQNSANGTDLTVTSADAIGDIAGIFAFNQGAGALTINSTGTATGVNFNGIGASNSANSTDLTINAVDTVGNQIGIDANNLGTGALSITSTGTVTGTNDNGIFAENSAAGTSLSVTAANATGGVDGINVLQEGTEAASVTTTGTVSGGTGNAITAETTGSAIVVNNSGTLESGAGFAVEAIGGVTQLTNSGRINGRVLLSAFDDVTVNNGLFNATLNSDFAAGNDLFTNEGTVLVGSNIAFNNLEQFVNDGLIDMRNGVIGNSLTLPGDYVGSGDGSFAFDVTFDGAGAADTLVIAGAATGNTVFEIDDISTSPNFGNMVLVVDAGAGTNEDAFELGTESQTIGFFAYSVFFDAPDNDFFLTNTIGTPVFQTLKFVEGAQSLWYRSADAWAAHMATPTDSSASPAWMQIYGTVTNQDDSFEFSAGGLTEPISVNYEQDYFGFQAGYEFGAGVTEDGGLFGLTGGYLSSNLGFDGTADNVRYDAFNLGAYAGLKGGRFFANALAKYDFITADVRARTAGYNADLDGYAYGVRLEAGYRLGDEKFFVQPLTSFEYQRASLDDFSALGADIDFDTFDGLRGMIGARLGGETKIKWGNNLTYYLGGQAVHQSQTGDGLTFTSGDTSIEIENRLSKTFGRFELGLSIATQGGVTGFIEGNADISGDYTGYGGRGGLKVQF
ncbi:autotransporter outer membrane beta-barrel domain-containing protein, partial [Parasphingorhabdus sp.]